MSLKATILLATLKPKSSVSHTEGLCQLLIEELKNKDVSTDLVRLVDRYIPPGVKTRIDDKDEWPEIVERLFKSDIIIFATPIWWGVHSSLMQRVLERLDELNDELSATGKSEFLI